jgi:toxin ParE1/3/4
MKCDIIWSEDAGDELFEILKYIKDNTGKITAEKIYSKIMHEVKRVSENAEGRRIVPLLKELGINDIHQFNVNPWILFYKVENKKMEIISIIDGRRNLEEILYKKLLDGKIT